MGLIEKNLLPDETILFQTRKSLFIFVFPTAWTIFCLFAANYINKNPILIAINWVPWLMALIFWFYVWLEYVTSQFVVTNKRVMMREGFFNRHATELRLATISQVNVDQSLIGQICNYGTISLNAFGASDAFSMIAQPLVFQKSVNAQLDKLVT